MTKLPRSEKLEEPAFAKALEWVKNLLVHQLDLNLSYHNWSHTESVILAADQLALHAELKEDQHAVLLWAALFHDTGFLKTYEGHEAQGISIFLDYFDRFEVPADPIAVIKLILVTRLSAKPQNDLEGLMKDADLNNVGQTEYFTTVEALWNEWRLFRGIDADRQQLLEENLHFLTSHRYYSAAANHFWKTQKAANIAAARQAIAAAKSDT